LVRHAKSSWKDPELEDTERPLNARGKRDAPRMGKRLMSRRVRPDVLISSPANRAYSTAVKIAREIGYAKEAIQINEKLYFEGSGSILKVIHSLPPEVCGAMLFSHNPTITYLVNGLANTDIGNVPTCGIAEITFNTESWLDVNEGEGTLQLFDYPKRVDD